MRKTYRNRIAKAVLETLENRRLMSTVTLDGGELLVQAEASDASLKAYVTSVGEREIRVTTNGDTRRFDAAAVRSVRISGTAGDDTLHVARTVDLPTTIQAGPGDDKVLGGSGDDVIDGQEGEDNVSGRGGNDTLAGGEGDDRLSGGAGTDTLQGHDGADLLAGGEGDDAFLNVDDADHGGGAEQARRETDTGGGELPPLPAPVIGPVPPPYVEPAPTPEPAPEPQPEPAPAPAPDDNGGTNGEAPAVPTIDVDPDAPSPSAVIKFTTDTSGMAGHSVHAHALDSSLRTGDALDARYQWDFGDGGSRFKKLTGWNAAHTYDTPGTYTVTLTVTNAGGKQDVATGAVTITADTRRAIYVDAEAGSDSNDGRSQSEAFRTIEAAADSIGDNTKLLVKNGQTHDMRGTVKISDRNVVLGTYGSGGKARVRRTQESGETAMFSIQDSAENFRAEGIEFDSVWGLSSSYGVRKVPARAFTVGGTNITIRDNVFRNLNDGVNTEREPTGVLVQDNLFTNEIRGYGIWAEGHDHVYLGNTMRDSRQEHLIRSHQAGVERVLIAHNDLTRRNQTKGSIELRLAKWFYVANNKMTGGTLRAGLAIEGDKESDPTWATDLTHWGVFERNVTERLFVNIRPGVQHMAVRDNVITVDDWEPVLDNNAILIQQTAEGYDHVRQTDDIRVTYNTVINNDSDVGHFLRVNGTATNITVSHNLYVAPHLSGDGDDEGGMVINAGMSAFRAIRHNVWPETAGPIHYLSGSGYQTASEWEALPKVSGDVYDDVTLGDGAYSVTVAGVHVGANL